MKPFHAFVITDVYSPQPDTGIDPTYKRLNDELKSAEEEKNRALRNFHKEPNIIPETAIPLGVAILRWKKANEAVKGYRFGLI